MPHFYHANENRFLILCSKRQSGRCLIILALALRRKLVCGMSTKAQYVGTADSSVLNGSIHSIIICSYCHDYHNILPRAIPSAPAVMITMHNILPRATLCSCWEGSMATAALATRNILLPYMRILTRYAFKCRKQIYSFYPVSSII